MNTTFEKIQYGIVGTLSLAATIFLVTTYFNWYTPSPFISFNIGLLALCLYAIHVIHEHSNRIKEITLVSLIPISITLIVSHYIQMIWKWEAIFTNVTMTKITLAMMMLLTIYGVMAYVRAKISYKKVRGNQRHNKTWRVGRKEADQLMKSDEIYIKLGEYYENNEQ